MKEIIEHYQNGNICKRYFINEVLLKEGLYEGFYESGKVWYSSNYTNGILDGVRKEYDEDGNLIIKCFYKNDKIQGMYEKFSETGELEKQLYYENGIDISKFYFRELNLDKILSLDTIKKIEIITNHIDKVRNNCLTLGKALINKTDPMGVKLIELGYCHDNSKFSGIEFEHLWNGSPCFLEALSTHQLGNKHHPEYWTGINMMPDLYLAEMVCDCWARAQEFGTDIRNWFENEGRERYGINEEIMEKIRFFLDLVLTPKFK